MISVRKGTVRPVPRFRCTEKGGEPAMPVGFQTALISTPWLTALLPVSTSSPTFIR